MKGVLALATMSRNLFWKLLEPEHPKAERFCRKLTGDIDEGNDLYQEAIVIALTKIESLKDLGSFRSWLYRIIINRYKNRFRSVWWRRHTELTDEIRKTATGDDPTNRLTARRWLEIGFTALKPDERVMITLYEMESWSVGELAELFGKPEGTVKAKLSRGRTKMRTAIEKYLCLTDQSKPKREAGYAFSQTKAQSE